MDEKTYIVSPIFVAKEHQKKGVGMKLLKKAKLALLKILKHHSKMLSIKLKQSTKIQTHLRV